MLAAAEDALIERLQNHRDIKSRVRTIASLPKLADKELLARYLVDAPAVYIVPGRFTVEDTQATLRFTLAGVVRNVAGNAQARKGDGIDLGCDQLVTLAIRALHHQVVGVCGWSVKDGQAVDEAIFDAAGIAAVEISLESTPIELAFDYGQEQIDQLPDFTHLHADVDIAPHETASEHTKWLQAPPDQTTAKPDAVVDVALNT